MQFVPFIKVTVDAELLDFIVALFWVPRHVNGIHDATIMSTNSSEGVHGL